MGNRKKKLANGRYTPREMHQMFGFPKTAKCAGCKSHRVAVRAIVMMPKSDAESRGLLRGLNMSQVHSIQVPIDEGGGKPVPYIRTSMTYSCAGCRKEFEKALGKVPSWCIVEINEGPNPNDRVVLGAGGTQGDFTDEPRIMLA